MQVTQSDEINWTQLSGFHEAEKSNFDSAEKTCLKHGAHLPQIEKDRDIFDIWYEHIFLYKQHIVKDLDFPGLLLGHKFNKSSGWTNLVKEGTRNEYLNRKNTTDLVVPRDLSHGCLFLKLKNLENYLNLWQVKKSNLWQLKAGDCSKISNKFIICAKKFDCTENCKKIRAVDAKHDDHGGSNVLHKMAMVGEITQEMAKLRNEFVQLRNELRRAHVTLIKNVKSEIRYFPNYVMVILISCMSSILSISSVLIFANWRYPDRSNFVVRFFNIGNSQS